MTKLRLAVIGAGIAGLSAAKNGASFGCDVTVFEQASQLGGTWVYSDNVGKDKHGLEVHSSMYKGLHTNLPKEIMGYPDFPIPKQEKSYIPSDDMVAFLNLYADKFDFRKNIKFEHHVIRVRPLIDDTWEIIVRNLPADRYETHIFDAVLVCNGHYHTPSLPKYEGRDLFKGKQIHSHDYRCPKPFAGECFTFFLFLKISNSILL
jgi:dimethylaniline monooxygenase (N-oxide forming)